MGGIVRNSVKIGGNVIPFGVMKKFDIGTVDSSSEGITSTSVLGAIVKSTPTMVNHRDKCYAGAFVTVYTEEQQELDMLLTCETDIPYDISYTVIPHGRVITGVHATHSKEREQFEKLVAQVIDHYDCEAELQLLDMDHKRILQKLRDEYDTAVQEATRKYEARRLLLEKRRDAVPASAEETLQQGFLTYEKFGEYVCERLQQMQQSASVVGTLDKNFLCTADWKLEPCRSTYRGITTYGVRVYLSFTERLGIDVLTQNKLVMNTEQGFKLVKNYRSTGYCCKAIKTFEGMIKPSYHGGHSVLRMELVRKDTVRWVYGREYLLNSTELVNGVVPVDVAEKFVRGVFRQNGVFC